MGKMTGNMDHKGKEMQDKNNNITYNRGTNKKSSPSPWMLAWASNKFLTLYLLGRFISKAVW
jgi:hypothetical protein